ncbi:hypothetical protein [Bacillus gaemokensis]|nr:hypothetical protein [Bacillus gaemokensis]
MSNENVQSQGYQFQIPNPNLNQLERLVSIWKVSGGAEGTVT